MSLGTTRTGEPLLFGWDDQTWQRAFVWAGEKNKFRVVKAENLTPEQWGALTCIHSLWMEKNGDPQGPQGRIIL